MELPSPELLLRIVVIGLSNGAIIALNAIAVTLVYGAVRMINFAHGDMFALTTVLITSLVTALGLSKATPGLPLAAGLLLALGAGMGLALLLNVAVERLAFRPFRSSSRLAPLIAGIGISFMLYQGALIWRRFDATWIPGEHRSVPGIPEVPRSSIPDLLPDVNLFAALGLPLRVSYTLKDLLVLLLAAGLAVAVGWFLRATRTGRGLQACAQDPEMAQLCGVDRDGAIRFAFGLGGALAGAGAFVFVLYYNHPFTLYGAQSGLTAFAAAVLGGIGAPGGAFLGGLVLGLIGALSDFFLAAQWTPVVVLALLVGLLILRPGGLSRRGDGPAGPAIELVAGYSGRLGVAGARWLAVGMVLLALAYPAIDQALGLRQQVIVTGLLIFALIALGLNIQLGFAGLLDLGFAACFALGGYTAGLLTDSGSALAWLLPRQVDFTVVLLASAAVAGLFGVINGALTGRLSGDELAIATLAFGQIVTRSFLNLDEWTNGARGIAALPAPRIFSIPLQTPVQRYYLALAFVLLAALVSVRLLRSRIGRAWRASSEDETAAASSGVNVRGARMFAFTLGAIVAGVAGALFAGIFSYVDPDTSDFRISAMALAMVVIGGAGSVPGVIVGALLVAGYDQLLIPLLGAGLDQAQAGGAPALVDIRGLSFLSFGLVLYLTVLLRASGRSGRRLFGGRGSSRRRASPSLENPPT